MSKLIVTQYMSADGVIEDPVGMEGSGLGNWIDTAERGAEGEAFKYRELFDAEALLLGRVTYDGFAAVWPTVKDPAGFADRINAMPKYVASRTMKDASWNNTHVLTGDLAEDVRNIKRKTKGDILVYGSASLIPPLAAAELIDEYAMMVYPVVLGRGKKLFASGVHHALELIENKTLGSGIALLRYAVRA